MTPPDWIRRHRQRWREKRGLRFYYATEIFDRIVAELAAGAILEIGSGPGFFRDDLAARGRPPVSIDIEPGTGATLCGDVHHLPFGEGRFANVVAVDALHHFNRPLLALAEIARVLGPGGRLVLVEPWTSPLGRFVYRHLHDESCYALSDSELETGWKDANRPMDGNAVIPKAVMADRAGLLARHAPGLRVLKIRPFGGLPFLMSGGFQPWGAPVPVLRALAAMGRAVPAPLSRPFCLRALLVLEKTTD